MKTDYDLLVIGAGPAGLSAAAECIYHELGSVLVLEKGEDHNQTVQIYYPDNKRVDAAYKGQEAICAGIMCFKETTKSIFLKAMARLVEARQLKIQINAAVDSVKKNDQGRFVVSASDGKVYTSRFLVIAIGRMGRPNRPSYFKNIAPTIKSSIHFDIRRIKESSKKILVVGGGNTAIEYALSLAKRFEVTVSYRKADFTRLNEMNLHLLIGEEKADGIRILRESNITNIDDDSGLLQVQFESGNTEYYDEIVYGIGGSSPAAFLESAGIKTDAKGNPDLDLWLQSSVKGLYVAGELSVPAGKGSIISSFNSGKKIIEGIMKNLEKERKPEIVSL